MVAITGQWLYLNSSFGEVCFHGYLLPGVNVGVVGLRERLLQFLQLCASERCPYTPLFAFFWAYSGIMLVHLIGES